MKQPRKRKHLNPNTVLLIKQIVAGVLIFGFLSMLIAGVWYGTRIPAFTLKDIRISGGESIAHEDIEAMVRDQLTGTYLGIVPRAFAFFYPRHTIVDEIKQLDRIKTVSIERVSGTTLILSYDEYIPDSLLCNDDDSECYFMDNEGFAFTKAPNLRGGAFLRIESIGMDPIRTQAFLPEEYVRIKTFRQLLADNGWYIARVEVDAAKDAYLSVVDGGEFKISLHDDPVSVIDNLLTVTGSNNFAHLEPGNFEYIDLRFGNRVFVNESEPEPEVVASSTEEIEQSDE